jgi:hypothetical protein
MTETMGVDKAKRTAKDRDGWECRFCGITNEEHQEEHGRAIEAHHIIKDNDNGADSPENLITVCRPCHNTLERTQADALSQIRENILNSINENWVTQEELEMAKREVKSAGESGGGYTPEYGTVSEERRSQMVRIDYYYYHTMHGIVQVVGFETEVVGADIDGEVKNTAVKFRVIGSEDSIVLTEYFTAFDSETRYESKYKTDLREKMEQHE